MTQSSRQGFVLVDLRRSEVERDVESPSSHQLKTHRTPGISTDWSALRDPRSRITDKDLGVSLSGRGKPWNDHAGRDLENLIGAQV